MCSGIKNEFFLYTLKACVECLFQQKSVSQIFLGKILHSILKKRKVLCNIIDTEVHISASVKNEIQDLWIPLANEKKEVYETLWNSTIFSFYATYEFLYFLTVFVVF